MSKYIHLFQNETDFNTAYNGADYLEPWVSYTEENGDVNYNKDMRVVYFTIESLGSGNITWGGLSANTVQYSKNNGEWTTMDSGTSISVVSGDEVRFKGTNQAYFPGYAAQEKGIKSTAQYNVKGNIMSLVAGDDFVTANTIGERCFAYLFASSTTLLSAEQLVLAAENVGWYSYDSMFRGCTSLVKPPKILATANTDTRGYSHNYMFADCSSLATAPELHIMQMQRNDYYQLFQNCTSLTAAPKLPATSLMDWCYYGMFDGCTGLTVAPELPVMDLAPDCYDRMFGGCTSLTQAPVLPATGLANNCYASMFTECTSLATAPALPTMTLANGCYTFMFYGCTSLTTAPELPAETLQINCYNGMFNGCSSLNYIKCMATDISPYGCLSGWVSGVADSGTFVRKQSTYFPLGDSGVPYGWTEEYA